MTQFKSKRSRDKESSGLGLLAYPVLQAADILLYQATHVPVGEDQHQHLELARDIAHAFHTRFTAPGDPIFQLPVTVSLPTAAARVMSLSDATCKASMSSR
jgi:tryptophanyl-tRNA synthetase